MYSSCGSDAPVAGLHCSLGKLGCASTVFQELSLNRRVKYTQDTPGGDLWARGRGCTGRKEPGAGESSGGRHWTLGWPGSSIAHSAPPAHPAPELGGRFCADLSAGPRELLMWGVPSAAGLMLIKAFPAGYEITIL